MLTGWVTAEGDDVVNEENGIDKDHTYYADETGARVENDWIYTVEPSTAEDDADADYYYYYLLPSGKVATGKRNNIKGQTYFFNTEGQMLSGWVKGEPGADGKMEYSEIDGETTAEPLVYGPDVSYYYCGSSDQGYAKKNRWIKLWRPEDTYEEDDDNTQYWYWIDKNGEVFVPDIHDDEKVARGDKYQLEDGALVEKADDLYVVKKKINSKDYFFNEEGEMLSQFIYITNESEELPVGMYYFGGSDDGSMKTGAETIKDDNLDSFKFYFETKGENKGVGITGNKSNKLYYMGHLVAAQDYRYQPVEIDGYTFIVNSNGTIQHSTVQYKEDGDVLIDASELTKEDFVTEGWNKYAVKNDNNTMSRLVIKVDELDPEAIMAVDTTPATSSDATESDSNAAESGTNTAQ